MGFSAWLYIRLSGEPLKLPTPALQSIPTESEHLRVWPGICLGCLMGTEGWGVGLLLQGLPSVLLWSLGCLAPLGFLFPSAALLRLLGSLGYGWVQGETKLIFLVFFLAEGAKNRLLWAHRLNFIYVYVYMIYVFILFLDALGLHCCVQAFSGSGELGLLFIAVRGLLIAVASLVLGHSF